MDQPNFSAARKHVCPTVSLQASHGHGGSRTKDPGSAF